MDKGSRQESEKPVKQEEPEDNAGLLALLGKVDPNQATTVTTNRFAIIECGTYWRGKTGGFWREVTSVRRIVDKNRNVLEPVWEKSWTEITPGIETRQIDKHKRAGNQEEKLEEAVKIRHEACPVYVRFMKWDSYEDYDDSRFSTSSRRYYWEHYVTEGE